MQVQTNTVAPPSQPDQLALMKQQEAKLLEKLDRIKAMWPEATKEEAFNRVNQQLSQIREQMKTSDKPTK